MVRNGKLITPDLTQSVLESITRDAIITLAREDLGIEVEERAVDRTELYMADEAFICGTHAEITPVSRSIGSRWAKAPLARLPNSSRRRWITRSAGTMGNTRHGGLLSAFEPLSLSNRQLLKSRLQRRRHRESRPGQQCSNDS